MSTRTPKSVLTPASTAIAVFPNPVPVFMIPLPADYPRLPLGEMNFQPVAYNQGTGNVTYVTVLVPLLAGQMLRPATEISMDGAINGYTFTYTIQIVTDEDAADDRLAFMSFSFLTPATAGSDFKVAIEVLSLDTIGAAAVSGPGKVVMDSNMDPTLSFNN